MVMKISCFSSYFALFVYWKNFYRGLISRHAWHMIEKEEKDIEK